MSGYAMDPESGLASRIRNDSKEFEEFYHQTRDRACRIAIGFLGASDEVQDVVQEAYLKAYRAFDSFQKGSSFSTWLYRIVVNTCVDHYRKWKEVPSDILVRDHGYQPRDIADEDDGNSPETILLTREAQFRCLHCLTECLPSAQRKAFCLTVTLDLPHKIAAEVLSCSEGAVKASLHRAMRRWKGYMENRCEFIKPENPCKCRQWIHFGREQGWLDSSSPDLPRHEIDPSRLKEILGLRSLRNLYSRLYADEADRFFARRLLEGVNRDEWVFFST